MKTFISYILIIGGLTVMAISTSRTFMEWASDKRFDRDEWWAVRKPVDGDLVAMSYLGAVKKFNSFGPYKFFKHPDTSRRVDLYALGDSHIWKVPDTAYAAVRNYSFLWRGHGHLTYTLDSTVKNVLILETTERYVRTYFAWQQIFNEVYKQAATANHPADIQMLVAGFDGGAIDGLFNPNINQNIEFNLFNYNFINPVREWKAALNYYLFNRASGDVKISKDGERLFIKETVAGRQTESTYFPLDDQELEAIVGNLNLMYDHYMAEGFDAVYFSMIPNPSSLLQPEGGNRLVERIEQHPDLRMPVISILERFSQQPEKYYRRGDTHWSDAGIQVWLQEVNKKLEQIAN